MSSTAKIWTRSVPVRCSKYRFLRIFLEFLTAFRLKDFQSCSWWYCILVFGSKKGQNRLSKFECHSQQILQSKLHWFWNELYSIMLDFKRWRTSQFQHDFFQRFLFKYLGLCDSSGIKQLTVIVIVIVRLIVSWSFIVALIRNL